MSKDYGKHGQLTKTIRNNYPHRLLARMRIKFHADLVLHIADQGFGEDHVMVDVYASPARTAKVMEYLSGLQNAPKLPRTFYVAPVFVDGDRRRCEQASRLGDNHTHEDVLRHPTFQFPGDVGLLNHCLYHLDETMAEKLASLLEEGIRFFGMVHILADLSGSIKRVDMSGDSVAETVEARWQIGADEICDFHALGNIEHYHTGYPPLLRYGYQNTTRGALQLKVVDRHDATHLVSFELTLSPALMDYPEPSESARRFCPPGWIVEVFSTTTTQVWSRVIPSGVAPKIDEMLVSRAVTFCDDDASQVLMRLNSMVGGFKAKATIVRACQSVAARNHQGFSSTDVHRYSELLCAIAIEHSPDNPRLPLGLRHVFGQVRPSEAMLTTAKWITASLASAAAVVGPLYTHSVPKMPRSARRNVRIAGAVGVGIAVASASVAGTIAAYQRFHREPDESDPEPFEPIKFPTICITDEFPRSYLLNKAFTIGSSLSPYRGSCYELRKSLRDIMDHPCKTHEAQTRLGYKMIVHGKEWVPRLQCNCPSAGLASVILKAAVFPPDPSDLFVSFTEKSLAWGESIVFDKTGCIQISPFHEGTGDQYTDAGHLRRPMSVSRLSHDEFADTFPPGRRREYKHLKRGGTWTEVDEKAMQYLRKPYQDCDCMSKRELLPDKEQTLDPTDWTPSCDDIQDAAHISAHGLKPRSIILHKKEVLISLGTWFRPFQDALRTMNDGYNYRVYWRGDQELEVYYCYVPGRKADYLDEVIRHHSWIQSFMSADQKAADRHNQGRTIAARMWARLTNFRQEKHEESFYAWMDMYANYIAKPIRVRTSVRKKGEVVTTAVFQYHSCNSSGGPGTTWNNTDDGHDAMIFTLLSSGYKGRVLIMVSGDDVLCGLEHEKRYPPLDVRGLQNIAEVECGKIYDPIHLQDAHEPGLVEFCAMMILPSGLAFSPYRYLRKWNWSVFDTDVSDSKMRARLAERASSLEGPIARTPLCAEINAAIIEKFGRRKAAVGHPDVPKVHDCELSKYTPEDLRFFCTAYGTDEKSVQRDIKICVTAIMSEIPLQCETIDKIFACHV